MPTRGNDVIPAWIIIILIYITSRKHVSIDKAALCISESRKVLAKIVLDRRSERQEHGNYLFIISTRKSQLPATIDSEAGTGATTMRLFENLYVNMVKILKGIRLAVDNYVAEGRMEFEVLDMVRVESKKDWNRCTESEKRQKALM
jgi:hypothetical protein